MTVSKAEPKNQPLEIEGGVQGQCHYQIRARNWNSSRTHKWQWASQTHPFLSSGPCKPWPTPGLKIGGEHLVVQWGTGLRVSQGSFQEEGWEQFLQSQERPRPPRSGLRICIDQPNPQHHGRQALHPTNSLPGSSAPRLPSQYNTQHGMLADFSFKIKCFMCVTNYRIPGCLKPRPYPLQASGNFILIVYSLIILDDIKPPSSFPLILFRYHEV